MLFFYFFSILESSLELWFKKINLFNLSDFKLDLYLLTIKPAFENILSEATSVASMHK